MMVSEFKPKNDRERLAYEAGRSHGLREAIQLQSQPIPPPEQGTTEPAEPSAEVVRLEDLLLGLCFAPFSDEDSPARQWRRGEEEVAIEEARAEEQVRWFTLDKDEPDTMTVPDAVRRAMDEGMHR